MNSLRKYMSYKRAPDLPFPWSYSELLSLPVFMIQHIYEILDEFLEEDKQKYDAISKKMK